MSNSMASTEHDIGAEADFVADRVYHVQVGGRALVIARRGERFFALRDICPHQGAHLSAGHVTGSPLPCSPGAEILYSRQGEIVTCPWHGWTFDLATGACLVDAQTRVRAYTVRVEGGRVWVDMYGT